MPETCHPGRMRPFKDDSKARVSVSASDDRPGALPQARAPVDEGATPLSRPDAHPIETYGEARILEFDKADRLTRSERKKLTALKRQGRHLASKNCPVDENTNIETPLLSSNSRFWKLFDRAAEGRKRTPLDKIP